MSDSDLPTVELAYAPAEVHRGTRALMTLIAGLGFAAVATGVAAALPLVRQFLPGIAPTPLAASNLLFFTVALARTAAGLIQGITAVTARRTLRTGGVVAATLALALLDLAYVGLYVAFGLFYLLGPQYSAAVRASMGMQMAQALLSYFAAVVLEVLIVVLLIRLARHTGPV